MNIAIKYGIALDRWCKSVTIMIEKDTGRSAIHRFRIIHLYEADYNLFLKLQWGLRLVRYGASVVSAVPTLPPSTTMPLRATTASLLLLLCCWRDVFACHGMRSRHMQKLSV